MAIYHYKNAALIDRVEISSPHPMIAQATLIARQDADSNQLETLRKKLGRLGFSTLMDIAANGCPEIQVRGLKDEKSFIAALGKLDLAHNGVEKDFDKLPKKETGFGARVRGKALFLSALFYDIGNIALGISGIQAGRHNPDGKMTPNDKSEFKTGLAFALGDVLMTIYGNAKGDEELIAANQGLRRHLHQKGIKLPQENDLNPDTLHQSGAMKVTDRWLRKHITRIKCLTELAGGLFMIHSGRKPTDYNRDKVTAGSLITIAWAATFLLEKPRGHKIFDGNGKDNSLIDKMTDNPRAWIAAPLAMGNNVFNLIGANKKRKEYHQGFIDAQNRFNLNPNANNHKELVRTTIKQHDYIWNVITACSFLVAHTLFGISGAKRPRETEDDKAVMNDLVLLSANVLAKQPGQVSNAAIDETAEYVSKLAHVTMTKEQVAEAIRGKVAALAQSTWVARTSTSPLSSDHQLTV